MSSVWKWGGSILTVVVLAWGCLMAVDLLARQSEEVDVDTSADGIAVLYVDVDSGSVEITGADTDRVTVRGTVQSGMVPTAHHEARVGTRFEVSAGCNPVLTSFCSVEHRIVVPRELEVIVRSADTTVELADLDGSVDVRTSDSGITATRLSGDLLMRTSNAAVDADALSAERVEVETSDDRVGLRFAEPPLSVDVHTSNGRVELVVPDSPASYSVDLQTDNGEASSDVRTDPTSERTIRVRTSDDDVRLSYPSG